MSDAKPAIVIVAFDRDRSLQRLLSSLSRAVIDHGVDLIISIDKNDNDDIYGVANSFKWNWGTKEILIRNEHMGLRRHVMTCGDLTETYGSIILLEDDLFVSPYFYTFARQCLQYYKSDANIAGVSLYSPRYNETSQMTFRPIDDGSDVFFLQIASSWGQCWTRDQWNTFRSWYENNSNRPISPSEAIPSNILLWPKTSWKKHFIRYMIETNRFFVYPRISFSTNFHDPGTHHFMKESLLQVPLSFGEKEMIMRPFEDSYAVYDSYHEILPEKLRQISPGLKDYEFEVDLYGQKNLGLVNSPYLVTVRQCADQIKTFGKELKPIELNIIYGIQGQDIRLTETSGCQIDPCAYQSRDLAYYYGIPLHFIGEEKLASRDRQWEIQMAQREHMIRAELNAILMSKETEISVREEQIRELRKSLSWKMTAPLRKIFDFLLKTRHSLVRTPFDQQARDKTSFANASHNVLDSPSVSQKKHLDGQANVDFHFGLSATINGLKLRGYFPEVVYDIGAADGAWTRFLLEVWPDSQYICFEPLTEWNEALADLASDFPGQVNIQHVGIADADTELFLGVTDSLYDSSFAYRGRTSRRVQVHTLDTLVGNGLPLPSFVKIDVQGLEKRVIEGAKMSIPNAEFVLMECTFLPFCNEMRTLDETIALMSVKGFIPYEFVDFLRRPLDGAMGQCDILFIKKDHWLVQDQRWCA